MSFSFIDEKNKILDIDTTQNYYLAGKNKDVLFISKTFIISDGIITFDVDTYTEPFLNEVQKRNTEIQIELGYNTAGVQKVLLRDYAFAQPRVYIEGLNPSKVNFADYYTKGEVDSLLSNINIDTSMFYTKEEVNDLIPEIPAVPTKLSELQNDSNFISGYTETDPIFSAVSGDLATKNYVDEAVANIPTGGGSEIDLSDFSTDTNISLKTSETIELSGFLLKWKQYQGRNGMRGIDFSEADFFDIPYYTSIGGKTLGYEIDKIDGSASEFYDSFNMNLNSNTFYYMPKDNCTNYLSIGDISNNSMIFFNTDPDNDFSYSIYFSSDWRINKPFDFKKGKSYCIAACGNCVFWCEVQYND